MFKKSVVDLSKVSKAEVQKFLNSFDTVLTDCDGVLWIVGKPIPGSADALNKLRAIGKQIFYVTNNSEKTREEFAESGRSMNFVIDKKEVVSSAYLTACYLKERNFKGKVYVLGAQGIAQELKDKGIESCGVGPDMITNKQEILKFKVDPEIKAVIVGMDTHLSYCKMTKATTYLNNPDVQFIGTNTDERFPAGGEKILPGTGSLVAAIECSSLRKATVIGKPSSFIKEALINEHGIDPTRTLIIGDRCNTDIALGSRCGFQTLLVLTGVTSLEDLMVLKNSKEEADQELIPDVYLNTLSDLLSLLDD